MYRITTDFWGSWGQVEQPGGGTLVRIGMLANDSLIGANGTFPDLGASSHSRPPQRSNAFFFIDRTLSFSCA